MSNSIIDQQRDNADFLLLPSIEDLFAEIQAMMGPDNREPILNGFDWLNEDFYQYEIHDKH